MLLVHKESKTEGPKFLVKHKENKTDGPVSRREKGPYRLGSSGPLNYWGKPRSCQF